MRDASFEWDDGKAWTNLAKHRVSFEEARDVFADPRALVEPDEGADEERDITIGMGAGRLLLVVSTERRERTRIISARKANRHEQNRYQRAASSRR